MLTKYKHRNLALKNLSMHQFFHHIKNQEQKSRKIIIPHYVGASTTHVYPPTEKYARIMLMIYKPWYSQSQIAETTAWLHEFQLFINHQNCPNSLRIKFYAAQYRYQKRLDDKTPTATPTHIRDDEVGSDDEGVLIMTGKHAHANNSEKWPKGEKFDWSKRFILVRL